MEKTALSIVWVLAWALPWPGGAAEIPAAGCPGPGNTIRWEQIKRLAERDPMLVESRLEIEAATGALQAAGQIPNPSLEASLGRAAERTGDRRGAQWDLALSFPLDWLSSRGPARRVGLAEVDAARARSGLVQREVLGRLSELFWGLVLTQARLTALESLEKQAAALLSTVRMRVQKGESRPGELVRLEIEAERVAGEREVAGLTLQARRRQLAAWLGSPACPLVAEADLWSVPRSSALQEAVARAQRGHPGIAAAAASVRALESQLEVERRARIPALTLKAFTSSELDLRAFGGALSVALPVWNWNGGRIVQAEGNLAAGKKRLESTDRQLQAAIAEAHAACLGSSALATRMKDRVLPRSRSSAEVVERTYQLGEIGILDVIDAQRTLVEVNRQTMDALAEAHLQCGRLGALIGEELP